MGESAALGQFAGRAICHKFCESKPLVSPGALSWSDVQLRHFVQKAFTPA
jgi:hypothetical protein